MVRPRYWLDRFRPAGSPGIAARPGVPADETEQDRETAAVFALLEPVEGECARIITDAEREASRRRETAAALATQLIAKADQQAPHERADAFARVAAESGAELERTAAQQSVAELRAAAEARMPGIVLAVYAQFLALVSSLSGVELPAPDVGGEGT